MSHPVDPPRSRDASVRSCALTFLCDHVAPPVRTRVPTQVSLLPFQRTTTTPRDSRPVLRSRSSPSAQSSHSSPRPEPPSPATPFSTLTAQTAVCIGEPHSQRRSSRRPLFHASSVAVVPALVADPVIPIHRSFPRLASTAKGYSNDSGVTSRQFERFHRDVILNFRRPYAHFRRIRFPILCKSAVLADQQAGSFSTHASTGHRHHIVPDSVDNASHGTSSRASPFRRATRDAVHAAGGVPIILPSFAEHRRDMLDLIDGLIFSGGADLDPALFGDSEVHPQTYDIHAGPRRRSNSPWPAAPTSGTCRFSASAAASRSSMSRWAERSIQDVPDHSAPRSSTASTTEIPPRTGIHVGQPLPAGSLLERTLWRGPDSGQLVPSSGGQGRRSGTLTSAARRRWLDRGDRIARTRLRARRAMASGNDVCAPTTPPRAVHQPGRGSASRRAGRLTFSHK